MCEGVGKGGTNQASPTPGPFRGKGGANQATPTPGPSRGKEWGAGVDPEIEERGGSIPKHVLVQHAQLCVGVEHAAL